MNTKIMLELKEIYETDTNNINGYYLEGHVDKEVFLKLLMDYMEDYLSDDEIEDFTTPKLDEMEHIWYRVVGDLEDTDFDNFYTNHYFLYSCNEKEGYCKMTKYEL